MPSLLVITKLLDIEEDIWSPTFRLKGKLHATLFLMLHLPHPLCIAPTLVYPNEHTSTTGT